LLRWVHCCEVDSLLSVARRSGVPLTDDDADRYVAEQVTAASLIGAPEARDAARLVLVPPMPTWVRYLTPARPAWGGLAALAFASLPRWARRMYSMPAFALTDAAATAGLRAFRQAVLPLPQRVRRSPIVWAGYER